MGDGCRGKNSGGVKLVALDFKNRMNYKVIKPPSDSGEPN